MKYYFAPMEGITGYIYRNAHHKFFNNVDAYYTPFLVPTQNRKFTSREKNDILPEHNEGLRTIPQIMTNQWEGFLWTAQELKKYGYQEVNLNLGCPSRTVVSKQRGSGFLAVPDQLDQFLDRIFSLDMKISIKTRIGIDSPDEFYRLMEIYNKYPLEELIIHPRIQKDFYRNTPNWDSFKMAVSVSKNPVCYNGDIFTPKDYERLMQTFPTVERVMLGRGLVTNPMLSGEIQGNGCLKKEPLKEFHDQILSGYQETISGDRNVLFKMKELWAYLIISFENGEKLGKKIQKSQNIMDYMSAVEELFRNLELESTLDISGSGY
ncbi:tRNA dihydrouridine synthase [Lacrimispora amygdalina]|uniref:tRNA dihydrouridine synthase n=1 Tax=Lacrimispora amygdalina TaxID=253257 RepID=UPI000BE42936|nr:tRNA-dihydrouridine synthase family protein [Lacrimispora amygdalina]